MAVGCDASHGDSGSALVDRKTGEAVGLLWTTKTPKKSEVQTKEGLGAIFDGTADGLWTELTYAVPMSAILKAVKEKNPELFKTVSSSQGGDDSAAIRN